MKDLKCGDNAHYMINGICCSGRIIKKIKTLCTMDNKTINTSFVFYTSGGISKTETEFKESKVFATKEALLVDFVNRNSKKGLL